MRILILSLIIFFFNFSIAQDSEEKLISPQGDTITLKPIPLLEISSRLGDFNTKMKTYNEKLKTIQNVYEIDTTAISAKAYLIDKKEDIDKNLNELTLANIENAKREWQGYNKTLNEWESTITSRIAELEETLFSILVTKNTWELTKSSAKELSIPEESLVRINEVLQSSKGIKKDLKQKQDSIITIQNRITDFQTMTDDILTALENRRKELQSEYFIQDSPALWRAHDSTMNFKIAVDQFSTSLNEHTKSIELFTENNSTNTIRHLFLFLILLALFIYLNHDFKRHELKEGEEVERIKYFLSRFILSSFLLTISFSQLFYNNMPTAIKEFLFVVMLIPTFLLLIRILPKVLRNLFLYIIFLFLIDEIHIFFTAKTLFSRSLLIFQDILFIWITYQILKRDSPIKEIYSKSWLKTITRIANILIIFAIISLLSNILGYVNLSYLLSNAIINVLILPIILSLLVNILKAFFTSLFKTNFFQHSLIISSYEGKIVNKISKFLVYFAIFLWIRSIFVALGLAEQVGNWIYGLMDEKWKIGSVEISFGGIIAFFLIILITSIVTKGLKYLLEDEIFPRIKLARGVPGAISMVIRYTIVAFGIYLALIAAGVDLGQFGLIAGALGVGIGFGLQGVVYNFIAGLILAFERPIQKGDTIEIGTLIGDVMNIGVRASTIRTYDGADVIVPNGSLISNDLINWTFTDRVKRRDIKVGVAYGTDPHKVMDLLFKVASENENVLPLPKPWPLFEGFGESSLNFSIRFWVNFDSGMTVKSQVAMSIYDGLAEAGIQIPFPQTDLHVKSFDPTVQKTILPFNKEQLKKTPGRKPGKPKKPEDSK